MNVAIGTAAGTRRGPDLGASSSILLAVVVIVCALSAAAPAAGSGQSGGGTSTPQSGGGGAPVTTGFQDGFVIQSADGNNRIVLGLLAQADGRFALGDPKPIVNTFTLRKFRPTLSGRIAKYFDFKMMPDFAGGSAAVLDAYVDVRFSPSFRVRFGKDKTPVGYELLISDAFLFFPERALASSLVPNRDIGVQAQGDLAGGKVSYAGGLFNGIPDGSNLVTDLDTNDAKDWAGRAIVRPFHKAGAPPGPLAGLGFHLGGSAGRQSGALPSFRTSVGQTYFSYDPAATASGRRRRLSPAVFYYYKSFGAFAEYARSLQRVARSTVLADVDNRAWEMTASYLLTGEPSSDRAVRPRNAFDPPNRKWGAVQVLARYSELTVDDAVFRAGLAAPRASRRARSLAFGTNWYPAAYVKFYATFERTVFEGSGAGARPAEDVILFRSQLAF